MAFTQNIRLSVDLLLVATSPIGLQVLLIERRFPPYQGFWALPGGFVDDHERLKDAALREFQEETGIALATCLPLGYYDQPDRDSRGRNVAQLFLALGGVNDYQPKAGDDAARASWHQLVQLPALAFDHAQMIQDAVAFLQRRAIDPTAWQNLLTELALPPQYAAPLRQQLADDVA